MAAASCGCTGSVLRNLRAGQQTAARIRSYRRNRHSRRKRATSDFSAMGSTERGNGAGTKTRKRSRAVFCMRSAITERNGENRGRLAFGTQSGCELTGSVQSVFCFIYDRFVFHKIRRFAIKFFSDFPEPWVELASRVNGISHSYVYNRCK